MAAETLSTLGGVVLGAVLATAGGVATERWKQRRELRAAARLVWLEVMLGYSVLLSVVARGAWPQEVLIWDDAWHGQRDRLALGLHTDDFLRLQNLYLALQTLAKAKPEDLGEPVLYWSLLESADAAARTLAKAAVIDEVQTAQLRTPLADRVANLREQLAQLEAASAGDLSSLKLEAVQRAIESFPPELRARAAEALARQIASSGGTPTEVSRDEARE
jgi:hypothetical protein